MSKNFAIAFGIATLVWVGCLYHTTTVNALQAKYEKTCASSAKKSQRIVELVRELKNERQTSRIYYLAVVFFDYRGRFYLWGLGNACPDGAVFNLVFFGKMLDQGLTWGKTRRVVAVRPSHGNDAAQRRTLTTQWKRVKL